MQKWAGIIIFIVALGWLAVAEASATFLAQEAQTVQVLQEGRASAAAPTMNIVYVDASVGMGGAEDGTSWANAYPTLQDALSDTTGVDEIWVAAGVYYPDEGAMQIANSVTATFQLTNSVEIYGGFAATETQRTQRDFLANITVLSGDIEQDDSTDSNSIVTDTSNINGANAYNVVTGSGTNSTAVLDGFTINAGQANGALSNPCSDQCGGGIYNNSGNPTLTNLTITANSARSGGGMFNNSSNPTLTNLIIKANSARSGGGMFNRSSSDPMLTNVTITANSASSSGGGMFNTLASEPKLINVTITANSASQDGGGMLSSSSNPALTNVTITANSASQDGGGMYNQNSSNPTLTNVIIWNNQDQNGTTLASASIFNDSSDPSISHSLIANSGGSGVGWQTALGTDSGNNIAADPLFVQDGDPNTTPPTEGDYRLQAGSPAIDAGDNNVVTTSTDLAGNPRTISIVVDMGAYEADAPQIEVLGANVIITDGVTGTNSADGTDFGDVLVGQPMTHSFTISNTGSTPLILNLPMTLSNSTDFAISTLPATTIAVSGSTSFDVTFAPSTTGTLSSTVEIANNDPDRNPFSFVVGGTGIAPEIDVQGAGMSISSGDTTPNTLDDTDFGDVLVGQGMTHTFTIRNTGSYPLTLDLPFTMSNTSDFAVSLPSTDTIPVSGSTSFDVIFTPSTTGGLSGTLSIGSNDSDENPFTFVVGGTGIAPEIDVEGAGMSISSGDTTPSTLDDTEFGDVLVGQGMTHTFTIRNTGSYPLTLDLPFTMSNTSDFAVSLPSTDTIPVSGSISFDVIFTPSTTGGLSGTLSIGSNDSDESIFTFVIGGTGVAPEIEVQGLGVSITNGDTTPSTLDDTDFGEVLVGQSMTHTFTISNTGSYSLTLDLPFTVSNTSDFAVSLPPTDTIPISGSTSFDVIFTPSTTGMQTATVNINSDDTDEANYTFEIQGAGVDTDGVDDSEEDGVSGVNGSAVGDGNGDGIPDREQSHVTSLRSTTNDYVTLVTDSDKQLINVMAVPQPAGAPSGVQFPYGHFSFEVDGLSTGEAFMVQMILHDDQNLPTTYWKYGPTPANHASHWYEFGYDGTTGAQINDNIITLHFVDGLRGDGDLGANGQLIDPGAPAINPTSPPPVSNQPPQLDQPIPDITVYEGAEDQIINLLDYFSDPEGDLLFFTIADNSNREVVPSALIGLSVTQFLTLQFGQPGTTEILMVAEEDVHHRAFKASFTVTVLPLPTLTISDMTVSEGDTPANFVVTLSPSSTQTVTVSYSTIAGSATSEDYVPVSGTLTIPAGELTGTISVPIIDDELAETDETFTIRLQNATNAKMLDGEAVITIKDDDQIATSVTLTSFSVQPSAVIEPVEMQGMAGAGWWIGVVLATCGWVVWRRRRGEICF